MSKLSLLVLFVLALLACGGIVYWAWLGSLAGVALSALVPGCCAVRVMSHQA